MHQCPNCGQAAQGLSGPCGCTWYEQAAATRIKERQARRSGHKNVIVDHLGAERHYEMTAK